MDCHFAPNSEILEIISGSLNLQTKIERKMTTGLQHQSFATIGINLEIEIELSLRYISFSFNVCKSILAFEKVVCEKKVNRSEEKVW